MRSFLIFIILALPVLPMHAQEPDSSSALFGLREAERNFARSSVMFGRNAAFIENMAEKSIIFTDKWITNGKEFSKNRKAVPIMLKWEPEFMDISASRDFGISCGPWEVQEYRPYTAPVSTGYFLSVWEKQQDNTWKVILDDGASTPLIKNYKHRFSFPEGADKRAYFTENKDQRYADELAGWEKQMLLMWKENHVASIYESFMAPGAVVLRNKHYPESNRDSVRLWISQRGSTFSWTTEGCKTASSGDLGFTYGMIVKSDINKNAGHYVRIWRKQGGMWKITIELINAD